MQETQEYLAFYEGRNSEKFVTSHNPENLRLVQRLRDRCSLENATGIDVSEAATNKAHRLTANKSVLRFIVGSAQALPFQEGSFDKIILNEVLEHVPDAEKVLSELSRVARPGALIFATSPNAFEELLPIFRPHARKVDRVEGHVRRYSIKTLTEAVRRHASSSMRHLNDTIAVLEFTSC
jgi:ubiquinone/menaquinone biosynthesis C-methylase UbiE